MTSQIKDAHITTRGAISTMLLMALVAGAMLWTDHVSTQLAALARVQDIGAADIAPIPPIDGSPCDRIYARTPDHVTCLPMRGDSQMFVVTVHDRHLCVAIYDASGNEVVAPTAIEVQSSTTADKLWRVLEPGLAVAATRDRKLIVIRIHDGDASRSILKLHWLDLAELELHDTPTP